MSAETPVDLIATEERVAALASAYEALARDLIAETEAHEVTRAALDAVERERDEARAERDRLARVLAVERGDASRAPEGWLTDGMSWWRGDEPRRPIVLVRGWPGAQRPLSVWYEPGVDGEPDGPDSPSALEAMEAADTRHG